MPNNLGNKETMARNIQYYMDLNHVNAADMCRVLNVPQSTFSYWLHARTYPRIDKIEKMATFFGITKADLVEERGSVSSKSAAPALSHEESRLVKLYRRADEIDKRTVMTVLSRYEVTEDPAPPIRYIRHYLVPAAAGYASPIEGEEYENVPLPPDAPQEADFCIEIQGDSMEPFIQDGQRVYIKQGAPLQEFDPGIFFVDGDVFCKQWCPGYGGQTYLLSANPKREDANITIFRDSGRSCVYFGKVLLGKKLPKPQYK